MTATDLIGTPLTADETALMEAYESLKSLQDRDLSPGVDANVSVALTALAVAVTDLGLVYEHLVDRRC